MGLAFGMKYFPVFVRWQQMNTYANELCRVAEVSGRIGDETAQEQERLNDVLKVSPDIKWNTSGKVQQNDEINVTCTVPVVINFGSFGSHTFMVPGRATGQSEVYWK